MQVVVLECEIDDMNPQIFGALMDKLYAAGALEVFYSAVQMKKNRPGTLMTIVAQPGASRDADRHRLPGVDDDWHPLPGDVARVPRSRDGDRGHRRSARCASRWRGVTARS